MRPVILSVFIFLFTANLSFTQLTPTVCDLSGDCELNIAHVVQSSQLVLTNPVIEGWRKLISGK